MQADTAHAECGNITAIPLHRGTGVVLKSAIECNLTVCHPSIQHICEHLGIRCV